MKTNVGGVDRAVRILGGLVLLTYAFLTQSWWALIGFVPIFTGLSGWCPAYLPFGISTCSRKES